MAIPLRQSNTVTRLELKPQAVPPSAWAAGCVAALLACANVACGTNRDAAPAPDAGAPLDVTAMPPGDSGVSPPTDDSAAPPPHLDSGSSSSDAAADGSSNGPPPLVNRYDGSRTSIVSFDLAWRFHLGDATGAEQASFDDSGWTPLDVPHDWSIALPFNESSAAGGGGGYLDGGLGWYRKTFTLPAASTDEHVYLQFDGVYMDSTVWVNGVMLGNRPYGYSSFEYDITTIAHPGAGNVVAVKVNNQQPSSRWYSGSGIYRHTWLKTVDAVHVAYTGTAVATTAVTAATASVEVDVQVENVGASDSSVYVKTTIADPGGTVVASDQASPSTVSAGKTGAFKEALSVASPKLWSLGSPTLYSVTTQVFAGGNLVDTYVSPLGIRTFAFDANTGFSLNGEAAKLNGVCLHHDLGSLGSAINYRALEKRLETMKAMGANAIRTSHNPPAPELLEICDRLGLVVMDEAFDCWYSAKNTYDYGRFFNAWAQTDIQAMVARDRNHPSVVLWSIGNEIPDVADTATAQKLIDWVRAEDPTRPITQNMNGLDDNTAAIEDLLGFSYNQGSYDSEHANHPTWKLVASESSSAVRSRGVYHLPAATNVLTDNDLQCSSYDNSVVGWGNGAEESWNAINTRPFMAGEFVWTGYDYIGEPTPYGWPAKSSYFGMVDSAGFPKDIYYFYQSHWNHDGPPMVHIVPSDWTSWSMGASVPVFAYSNCDSVELFLNGSSLGAQTGGKTVGHLAWSVPFAPGTLQAKCTQGGTVAATDEVKTAGAPAAIKLSADRSALTADGRDLAFVEADIVDANGIVVPGASDLVQFDVSGAGTLAGIDNGNPISVESYTATSRSTFSGKVMALVRSQPTTGTIHVSATAPVDVARGKAVTADSEQTSQNHAGPEGNDGDLSTRWCANDGNTNHWWRIDLGSAMPLTGSQIVWETSGSYGYTLATSNDATSWTTVVNRTGGGVIDADSFNVTARYVQITVTTLPPGVWASFYEMKIFSSATSLQGAAVDIQTLY